MRTLTSLICLALFVSCSGNPPEPDVPNLLADLQNPDPAVSGKANLALIQAGGDGPREHGPQSMEAVPALIRSLKDRDPMVRQWSARALGSIGRPAEKAVPALVEAAKNEGIRPTVEESIRKIRGLPAGQENPLE
jgi:HEAT repeat protein